MSNGVWYRSRWLRRRRRISREVVAALLADGWTREELAALRLGDFDKRRKGYYLWKDNEWGCKIRDEGLRAGLLHIVRSHPSDDVAAPLFVGVRI